MEVHLDAEHGQRVKPGGETAKYNGETHMLNHLVGYGTIVLENIVVLCTGRMDKFLSDRLVREWLVSHNLISIRASANVQVSL